MTTHVRSLSIVAGIMLLLAIPAIWPYAYFQILRIVVTVTSALNAYAAYKSKDITWLWIMGIIAVLFNPIAPIYMQKGSWITADLVAAVFMFAYLTSKKRV